MAFGRVTAEKRVEPILRGLAALGARDSNVHLVLVGEADGFPSLASLVAEHRLGERVHVTGHVADDLVAGHLAAADVCLCLRWPTAGETSASWLRALAAGRPTVITALAHLVDVPTTRRHQRAALTPVARTGRDLRRPARRRRGAGRGDVAALRTMKRCEATWVAPDTCTGRANTHSSRWQTTIGGSWRTRSRARATDRQRSAPAFHGRLQFAGARTR